VVVSTDGVDANEMPLGRNNIVIRALSGGEAAFRENALQILHRAANLPMQFLHAGCQIFSIRRCDLGKTLALRFSDWPSNAAKPDEICRIHESSRIGDASIRQRGTAVA